VVRALAAKMGRREAVDGWSPPVRAPRHAPSLAGVPADETVGQAQVAARRRVAAPVTLMVLLVAAVVSAASLLRHAENIAGINLFFAEAAAGYRILAGLYGALAGVALVGGVVVLVGRPRLGRGLLLVVLVLSVPGQALILWATVVDHAEVLDGSGRIIGQPSVALAVTQLVAVALAALATSAAAVAVSRRR
jgi:hypothetical protein